MKILTNFIKCILKKTGTFTVNGKSYSGNNMVINSNGVSVDGYNLQTDIRNLNIEINGDIESIDNTVGNITVNGYVNKIDSTTGTINASGNVNGNINTTTGNVKVGGTVNGKVTTVTGNVKCEKINRFDFR